MRGLVRRLEFMTNSSLQLNFDPVLQSSRLLHTGGRSVLHHNEKPALERERERERGRERERERECVRFIITDW